MNNWKRFQDKFSKSSLQDIYDVKIRFGSATGVDNISQSVFQAKLTEEIALISQKVLAGKYRFSPYKLRLISKGPNKYPRPISIPTIRDRLTLRALCEYLIETEFEDVAYQTSQDVVKSLNHFLQSNSFDTFIKLDIKDYYPSINHEYLLSRIRRKIRKAEILSLIETSIKNPTVSLGVKPSIADFNNQGIPQGISISNILALIYLGKTDRQFQAKNIFYGRYVDDILILCQQNQARQLIQSIKIQTKKICLEIHSPHPPNEESGLDSKSKIGSIKCEPFSYLGYRFDRGCISVREKTVDRLRGSIVGIFTAYKKSKKPNQNFLLWRLNLRITGCVYEQKTRGWLLYFSQINDESLLHKLDHYVAQMSQRFKVSVTPKKFVRTYYFIQHNLYTNKYIPNFDMYDLDDMKRLLNHYFDFSYKYLNTAPNDEIEWHFKRKISYQIRELEEDLRNFS